MLFFAFALARAQSVERCSSEDGVCLLQLRSNSDSSPEGHIQQHGSTKFLSWLDGGMELAAIPALPCAVGSTDCRARLLTMAKEHACSRDGPPAEGWGVDDEDADAPEELQLRANQTDLHELGSEMSSSSE